MTYQERINRFRILRHEDLPESHKAAYRAAGINPDDNWSLIWSFETLEAAEEQLAHENARKPGHWTFKLVDAGRADVVEREEWF